MIRKFTMILIVLTVLAPTITSGFMIDVFSGLDELIKRADTIVILRIDKELSDFTIFTGYKTCECYIYQTLKGTIPTNQRIRLQLMDTRSSFVSPYIVSSTHLVFLTKKQTANEPTDYRSLKIQGANVLLSPFGNEKITPGKTIKKKIQTLLGRAVKYNKKQYDEEQAFLTQMLEEVETPVKNHPSSSRISIQQKSVKLE